MHKFGTLVIAVAMGGAVWAQTFSSDATVASPMQTRDLSWQSSELSTTRTEMSTAWRELDALEAARERDEAAIERQRIEAERLRNAYYERYQAERASYYARGETYDARYPVGSTAVTYDGSHPDYRYYYYYGSADLETAYERQRDAMDRLAVLEAATNRNEAAIARQRALVEELRTEVYVKSMAEREAYVQRTRYTSTTQRVPATTWTETTYVSTNVTRPAAGTTVRKATTRATVPCTPRASRTAKSACSRCR